MSKLFESNRKRFAKLMDNNSLLVSFAGNAPVKRGDESYRFAPQRNFYYMTGIDCPSLIFVMHKNADGDIIEKLYLQRFDELEARWSGAVLQDEEAAKISGIENYAFLDEFHAQCATLFVRSGVNRLYVDMENRSFSTPLSPELSYVKTVGESFPFVKTENAYPMFTKLRLIKSKDEIKNIKKAISITNEGLLAMMKNTKPGMMEYEIEAHFDYTTTKHGCRDKAFATILASGQNGTVLHYCDNNSKVNDGDLILIDFGAQWNWYSADVTRTFPANGKFTERQREIYNIVLEGNKKIIDMIKPGIAFSSLNETLRAYYAKELKKIGLIDKKEDLSNYYFHGVSHMLGLETHDIGRGAEGVLKKGMVLTVEPGLYISEEGIGIRIEDDILVTDDGCEVLTKDIIKSVEEIEEFMSKRKGKGNADQK